MRPSPALLLTAPERAIGTGRPLSGRPAPGADVDAPSGTSVAPGLSPLDDRRDDTIGHSGWVQSPDVPPWLDLLNDVRHAAFAELETFGYRRLMGGGGLSIVPIDDALPVNDFVELALRLLVWQERFSGHEEWNYDDLQLLAEAFDSESDEWSESRPQVAGAMRAFTQAAWTVL